MLLRSSTIVLGTGLLLFCLITLSYVVGPPNTSSFDVFRSSQPACSINATYLVKHLNVSRVFDYSRREIRTVQKKVDQRPLTTNITEQLFSKLQRLRYDGRNHSILLDPGTCGNPLILEVPRSPKKVDASHIMFGMATNIDRLPGALPQLMHWLPSSGASLLIVTPDYQLPSVIHETEYYMRALGIDATIVTSSAPFANRYLSLYERLHLMSRSREKPVDWFAFIDDDTFIPSLPSLLTHLRTHYDPRLPWFISSLSEDFNQVRKHGFIGYGGSGIFLSRPLVQTLHNHYPACALKFKDDQGDHMLTHCINKYTTTRLTIDYDLHQLDFRGDVSGFFQSGHLPLTLHHWRSWFAVDVARMALVSRVAGANSILQRWRFPPLNFNNASFSPLLSLNSSSLNSSSLNSSSLNSSSLNSSSLNSSSLNSSSLNFSSTNASSINASSTLLTNSSSLLTNSSSLVLSNGFSLVRYAANASLPSDEHVEWTWRANELTNEMTQWEHAVGPLAQPRVEGKDKETYRMVDAWVEARDGSVRQIYYRNGTNESVPDRVFELVWLR